MAKQNEFPMASILGFGPDDKTVTKIVVGVIASDEGEIANLEQWEGPDVACDPEVNAAIHDFMAEEGVKTVVTNLGVMGCPHEEGDDFPEGQDCPFCPFWKGKQSSQSEEARWKDLKVREEPLGPSYTFPPLD